MKTHSSALSWLAAVLLFGATACQSPSDSGSTTPPDEDQSSSTESDVDVGYVSTLPETELVTIKNIGDAPADITLYAGRYDSTASQRKVRKSWSIPAGSTTFTLAAADIDHQNLWFSPTSGTLAGYSVYLSASSLYCKFVPFEGNDWVLTISLSSYASWTFQGDTAVAGYDWTMPPVTDSRSFGEPATDFEGRVVSPRVNILNSPSWDLASGGANIVRSSLSDTTHYIYGVTKLKYTGSTPRSSIKVIYRLRNADNTKRYFDYSWGIGTTVKLASYGDSAVMANGDLARALIIENLTAWGMTADEVTDIDVFVTSSSLGAHTVPAALATEAPVWTSVTDGYLPFTNNTGSTIDYDGTVVFKDSHNREYAWTYPTTYLPSGDTWAYSSAGIVNGGSARITFSVNIYPLFDETFSVANMEESWSPVEASLLGAQARPLTRSVSVSADPEETLRRFHEERDRWESRNPERAEAAH